VAVGMPLGSDDFAEPHACSRAASFSGLAASLVSFPLARRKEAGSKEAGQVSFALYIPSSLSHLQSSLVIPALVNLVLVNPAPWLNRSKTEGTTKPMGFALNLVPRHLDPFVIRSARTKRDPPIPRRRPS
jgi:hypothetical protein